MNSTASLSTEEQLHRVVIALGEAISREIAAENNAKRERERANRERENAVRAEEHSNQGYHLLKRQRELVDHLTRLLEQERVANSALLAKLRELGVNPDDVLKATG